MSVWGFLDGKINDLLLYEPPAALIFLAAGFQVLKRIQSRQSFAISHPQEVFRVLHGLADGGVAVFLVDQPLSPVIGIAQANFVQRFFNAEEVNQLLATVAEVALRIDCTAHPRSSRA